ncbi:hypothetical protein PspLS_06544 [Pyricularia sp. CBS 133598]|nr:hypothetical protein PspLS_06544 [Pyricularia sp. CBS 133598]
MTPSPSCMFTRNRPDQPNDKTQETAKTDKHLPPATVKPLLAHEPAKSTQRPDEADEHAPEHDVHKAVDADLVPAIGTSRAVTLTTAAVTAHPAPASTGTLVVVHPRVFHAAQRVGRGHRIWRVTRGLDGTELQSKLVHFCVAKAGRQQTIKPPRPTLLLLLLLTPGPVRSITKQAGALASRGKRRWRQRTSRGRGRRVHLDCGGLGLRGQLFVGQQVADGAVDVDPGRGRSGALDGLALAACRGRRRQGMQGLEDGGEGGIVGQDAAGVDKAQAALGGGLLEARADQVLEGDDGGGGGPLDVKVQVGQAVGEADG